MNFLFWNIANRDLGENVARIAKTKDVDIIILCEASASTTSVLDALNRLMPTEFFLVDSLGCEHVSVITRFSATFCSTCLDDPRFTIKHFQLPGRESFILVGAHLQSKLYADVADQSGHSEDLANEILAVEDALGHSRTIVVGDLNQNPYEEGLVSAKGLNAVMSRESARRRERTFNGRPYRLFYNPMWSKLGDSSEGPSGTYYRTSTKKCETFWHMLDQVLIRPDLMDRFENVTLEILISDGTNSLVNKKNKPCKQSASDHLPVHFTLNI